MNETSLLENIKSRLEGVNSRRHSNQFTACLCDQQTDRQITFATSVASARIYHYLLSMRAKKSAWKEDQDGDDDSCEGGSETDTIQHGDHHAPFTLVLHRFTRWRVG